MLRISHTSLCRTVRPHLSVVGATRPLTAPLVSKLRIKSKWRAHAKPPESKEGKSPEQPEEEQGNRKKKELENLLVLLVRYPGLYGTAAVLLGYFLHTPALGNFHWDSLDALWGLKLAVPLMLLDSLLMLPDYAPGTTLKLVKLKVPKAVADQLARKQQQAAISSNGSSSSDGKGESGSDGAANEAAHSSNGSAADKGLASAAAAAATAAAASAAAATAAAASADVHPEEHQAAAAAEGNDSEQLVEIEQEFPVGNEQPPLLAALHRLQREKAAGQAALGLSLPSEVVLMMAHHLASEMLWRGVVLTCVAGWFSSLLYTVGGLDDYLFVTWGVETTQVGAVLALALTTGAAVWSATRQEQAALRLVEVLEEATRKRREAKQKQQQGQGEGGEGEKKAGSSKKDPSQRLSNMLAKMRTRMSEQRKWSAAVEATRQATETVCLSLAFLLTGNLLAPYVAALFSDVVFSGYQKLRQARVDKEQRATMERLATFTETLAELRGTRAARIARLQPKAPAASKGAQEQRGDAEKAQQADGSSESSEQEQQ